MKIFIYIFIMFQSMLFGDVDYNKQYMEQCMNYDVGYKKALQGCEKEINFLLLKNELTLHEKSLLGKSYMLKGTWLGKLGKEKEKFEYYMKSYNVGYCAEYNQCIIGGIIGYQYDLGIGVKQNKIKAYQFYLKSAKFGSKQSQNNLDILCRESPWACK